MKTFKAHLKEAKTPKDIKLAKYTFKYNKKDSDKDREWYDFTGKYKDAFYITVRPDDKYAELNWNISDEGGLIAWIRDVQKKTFFENLGIAITFDSLNGFSSLDPKNEALGLLLRFLTFK